jgi:hypothetical protein
MNEHCVLSITEELDAVIDDDGYEILPYQCSMFLVSTRKLEAFKRDEEGKYRYVSHLIEGFLAGRTEMATSRKFSFGDVPDWYESLAPSEGFNDPVREVSYTVYR